MKATSITEWQPGDKGITKEGQFVTVESVSSNMVKIKEDVEKKLYIPAHGEIGKDKRIPTMPRINPHATMLKQDEQLRCQLAWLRRYGFKDCRQAQEAGY